MQPDKLMNTMHLDNGIDVNGHHGGSFVSSNKSSSGAINTKKSVKPQKPPKSVKNRKLPKDPAQKGRTQFFGNEPKTTKGSKKILFGENEQKSGNNQSNKRVNVRLMDSIDFLDCDIVDVQVGANVDGTLDHAVKTE